MRIAFDAKRLFKNQAGLGNYTRTITEILVELYPHNQYLFCTPAYTEAAISTFPFLQSSNVTITAPTGAFYKRFSTLWRSIGVVDTIAAYKADIYHGLSNEMPMGMHKHTKTIVTIHDVIFRHYPKYYNAIDRRIYDFKTRYAVKHAHAIVATNNQTKQDLVNLYGADPAKVHYIEQPCKPMFSVHYNTAQLDEVKSELNLPDNFILYVGTIESRKNLGILVQALALMNETDRPHIVVVGKPTDYMKTVVDMIEHYALSRHIHFYHNISNTQLPALYHLCKLYANPSLMEGFGAPILEALTCGAPVLCSDGAYFKDTFEYRCTYAAATNAHVWAEKIQLLCNSTAKPVCDLSPFTREAVAHKLMALYEQLQEVKSEE